MPVEVTDSMPSETTPPLQPIDRDGNRIGVGSVVVIPCMPKWLVHDLPADDVAQLRAVEGERMRVLEIDAHGYVWFGTQNPWFCLRPDEIRVEE